MTGEFLSHLTTALPWLATALLVLFVVNLLYFLTQSKKNEKELKENMAQVKALMDSAAEGIYGLDLEGNCTFCNNACLRLLGYEHQSELLGKNLHEMIHHTRADGSPYPAEDCRICHAYLYNSKVHLEDEVLWRKDSSSFPVEYWSYPINRGKETIGAVVSFMDITERKQAENRLIAAKQEMDAFVYTISHDLRTPISAVIGYADIIQETYGEELNDDAMRLLKLIETQGQHMSMLVEDLLALAKTGKVETPEHPVDVINVVTFVISELENERLRTGLDIKIHALPDVLVPESLMTQIFENLIGNALRYAGEESGTIDVGGERTGSRVRYYVRDHGKGIPLEEKQHIFDLFYRGTTGKEKTGTGVGLATVKKICRLYDGTASVEDTPGGGATFYVELNDSRS